MLRLEPIWPNDLMEISLTRLAISMVQSRCCFVHCLYTCIFSALNVTVRREACLPHASWARVAVNIQIHLRSPLPPPFNTPIKIKLIISYLVVDLPTIFSYRIPVTTSRNFALLHWKLITCACALSWCTFAVHYKLLSTLVTLLQPLRQLCRLGINL